MKANSSLSGEVVICTLALLCASLHCRAQGCRRTLVSVELGAETSNIDIGLEFGGWISGHVRYAGAVPPEADVLVEAHTRDYERSNATVTKADGRAYKVEGLAAGTYYVLAHRVDATTHFIYYDGSLTLDDAEPVEVCLGQDTPNIDITLPVLPGGAISGHVYEADGLTPLPQAAVSAVDILTGNVGAATTDAEGAYLMLGLSAGAYYVAALHTGCAMLWYPGTPNMFLAVPVEVAEDADVQGINFSLPCVSGTGSISGLVYPRLEGIRVELRGVAGMGSFHHDTTETGGTGGRYTFTGVPSGEYLVKAGAFSEYAPRFYGDSPSEEGAARVAVADGAHVEGIDIHLPLGGSISGRVYDAGTGAPIADLRVSSTTADGTDEEGNFAITREDGSYTLNGLDEGGHYVIAGQDSKYAPAYYSQICMESVHMSPQGIILRWTSEEGRAYKVLLSLDLLSWDELAVTIFGAPGQAFTEWCDSDALTIPLRFYRVRELD